MRWTLDGAPVEWVSLTVDTCLDLVDLDHVLATAYVEVDQPVVEYPFAGSKPTAAFLVEGIDHVAMIRDVIQISCSPASASTRALAVKGFPIGNRFRRLDGVRRAGSPSRRRDKSVCCTPGTRISGLRQLSTVGIETPAASIRTNCYARPNSSSPALGAALSEGGLRRESLPSRARARPDRERPERCLGARHGARVPFGRRLVKVVLSSGTRFLNDDDHSGTASRRGASYEAA